MKELLKLINIGYEVLDTTIFTNINASVQQGEVIGIIGKNGAGKSTLLQLINKEIVPTDGHIKWVKEDLSVKMVEQETENYDLEKETFLESKLLEKWQVPTKDFRVMSGGEKLKARLGKGFAHDADLLLLDEPTNHLDEQSMALLHELITAYKGTIIIVSHDRYFLDKVTTKIWSLENKQLIEHKGNYTSYMEAREQKRLTQ